MKTRNLTIAIPLFIWALVPSGMAKADEPVPGVARVSLIHGDVSTMRGDSKDWVASTINAPLVHGDSISTGARSRTEVQLDYANVLRLDQHTQVKVADLTRTRIQLQVSRGTVQLTALKGAEADVEVDTPNVAVRPLGEGTYRIQVNSESETEVTARKGEAEISTPQGNTTLEKDHRITVQGATSPEYQVSEAPARDEWDQWNRERDDAIAAAQSWRHTNRYYTGTHDLDRYGHWVYVPRYGEVWSPYAAPDWVPYRDGRWLWEPYWGWTWVSYEPWGWAPYHYGRWFNYRNSWCWWPGYVNAGYVPAWAPAWVSFVGFGFGRRHFNFGFGFGFSSIGWCPLAPFDTYSPWWGFRNTYNVLNISNITNITNVQNTRNVVNGNRGNFVPNRPSLANLQNAVNSPNARRAITAVPVDDFVRGRMPRGSAGVDVAALRQAHLVQGTLPVAPTRESLRPTDRGVRAASLPGQASTPGRFFTTRPAPAGPAAFEDHAGRIRMMMENHNPIAAANRAQGTAQVNTAPPVLASGGRDIRLGGRPTDQVNAMPSASAGAGARRVAPQTEAASPLGGQGPPSWSAQPARTDEGMQIRRPQPAGAVWQRFGHAPPGAAAAPSVTPPGGPSRGEGSPTRQSRSRLPESYGGQAGDGVLRPAGEPPPVERFAQAERPSVDAPPETMRPPGATPSAGWRRFGDGGVQRPFAGPPAAVQRHAPSPISAPAETSPLARPAPNATPDRPNWRRFAPVPERQDQAPAPREAPARQSFPMRPAPAVPNESPGGWQRFNREARPAPLERRLRISAPQPQDGRARASEGPGWNRFSPGPGGVAGSRVERNEGWNYPARRERMSAPAWRSESPRGYSRPPLQMQRPIVVERSRGGWGGGNHGPRGGGRSAPAPPPRASHR